MVDDEPEVLPPEGRASATELLWRCGRCGYQRPRAQGPPAGRQGPPERCPDCDAPREEFYLVTED